MAEEIFELRRFFEDYSRNHPEFMEQVKVPMVYSDANRGEAELQNPCYLLLTDASVNHLGDVYACSRKHSEPYRIGHLDDLKFEEGKRRMNERRWRVFRENPCYTEGFKCFWYLVKFNSRLAKFE